MDTVIKFVLLEIVPTPFDSVPLLCWRPQILSFLFFPFCKQMEKAVYKKLFHITIFFLTFKRHFLIMENETKLAKQAEKIKMVSYSHKHLY